MVAYADIRNASPVYQLAVGQDEAPLDLAKVQQFVAEHDGLLLQYLVGAQGGYVLVVPAAGEPKLVALEITVDQEELLGVAAGPLTSARLTKALLNKDKTGVLDEFRRVGVDPRNAADVTDRLHSLWNVLIPPKEQELIASGDLQRLFIVPDGPLTLLPFESLVVDGEAGSPRYVLDVGPPVIYEPTPRYCSISRCGRMHRSENQRRQC